MFLALSLPLVLISATAALPTTPPRPGDELFDGLTERWESARTGLAVPGLAVVVVLDDEVVLLETYGVRDTVTQEPVTADSAFYIASATKPFVAMAVAALADEGKLDLDAPVKRYLPRFQLADEEATESITVRDILCHAPGLNHGLIVLLDAYTGEITEDRYYHFMQEVSPAGRTDYSNVHFTLAGRIVEAITGNPWREELRTRIFEPAGMTLTTGYADEMYARDDVAMPTIYSEGGLVPSPVRKTNKTMHAAGGLGTTAHDVAQWLRLNLNQGTIDGHKVISKARAREMQTQQSTIPGGGGNQFFRSIGFGLGWQVASFQGTQILQHGGGYVGSASLITFVPEAGIGVGVLANTDAGGNLICGLVTADILDRILVGEGRDQLPSMVQRLQRSLGQQDSDSVPPNPTEDGLTLEPEAYVGSYTNEHLGTLRISLVDDNLTAHLGDYSLMLGRGAAVDQFITDAGGLFPRGSFVVQGQKVTGVTGTAAGQEFLFER